MESVGNQNTSWSLWSTHHGNGLSTGVAGGSLVSVVSLVSDVIMCVPINLTFHGGDNFFDPMIK